MVQKKYNTHHPKVSVLMPIFNTPERHLREAIESILNQTFNNFEYLILNDSPENTVIDEIVLSYDDPRIKYTRNEENIGLEASTNKLVNNSTGDYLAIFDHDDISLPDRLAKEVKYLDENPLVGVVSGQFRVFGTEDIITENPLSSKKIRAALLTSSCVSHTSVMYRKSVLINNNIKYEKEYFPAASYRIITRLALVTNIVNLPDMLLRYRMDGNNTSIKHAEARAKARQRIQKEYGEDLVKRACAKHEFDSVELLNKPPYSDERRYYRATKGKDSYFIKVETHDLTHEYQLASKLYIKSNDYFVKPIAVHNEEYSYLVMAWHDGVSLEKHLADGHKIENKEEFVGDLYNILKNLRNVDIVHRDITPRNLIIYKEKVTLIDFHYAVEYSNYVELDQVIENIGDIGDMGEPYSAGMYKWDDAYSLKKIIEKVVGIKNAQKYTSYKNIMKHVGGREIIPSGSILRTVILNQKEAIVELRNEIDKLNIVHKDLEHANMELKMIKESKSYKIGLKITQPYRLIKKLVRII